MLFSLLSAAWCLEVEEQLSISDTSNIQGWKLQISHWVDRFTRSQWTLWSRRDDAWQWAARNPPQQEEEAGGGGGGRWWEEYKTKCAPPRAAVKKFCPSPDTVKPLRAVTSSPVDYSAWLTPQRQLLQAREGEFVWFFTVFSTRTEPRGREGCSVSLVEQTTVSKLSARPLNFIMSLMKSSAPLLMKS